jgi:hypothetical protein
MAGDQVTFQIVSIKHNAIAFEFPIGAGVDEIVQYLPITFSTNVFTQIAPIQGRQIEGEAMNYQMAIEHTIGTLASFEIQLKEAGGGTAIITATNMLIGNISRNMSSPPYTKRTSVINGAVPVFSVTV